MRALIVAACITGGIIGLTCVGDPGIAIRVANDTSRDVCVYDNAARAAEGRCNTKVPPGSHVDYGYICTADRTASLFLVAGGERIYKQTATCGAWRKAGAVVTVLEDAQGLHATDRLSGAPGK